MLGPVRRTASLVRCFVGKRPVLGALQGRVTLLIEKGGDQHLLGRSQWALVTNKNGVTKPARHPAGKDHNKVGGIVRCASDQQTQYCGMGNVFRTHMHGMEFK